MPWYTNIKNGCQYVLLHMYVLSNKVFTGINDAIYHTKIKDTAKFFAK